MSVSRLSAIRGISVDTVGAAVGAAADAVDDPELPRLENLHADVCSTQVGMSRRRLT